jgi:hypothetical protein
MVTVAIIMGVLLLIGIQGKTGGERTGMIVLYALLTVVTMAVVRFKRAEQAFHKWYGSYLRFAVAVFAMTVPYLVLSYAGDLLVRMPSWLQIAWFVLWGLLLGAALLVISTERWRERVLEPLAGYNFAVPAVYSFQVLMLACLFFSSVTFVLVQNDVIFLMRGSADAVTPGSLSDLFLWHFLEAVPLLDINETLGWAVPLTYDSAAVGWILLLFKIVVIVPVIGAFTWYSTRTRAAPSVEYQVSAVAGFRPDTSKRADT